MSYIGVLWGFFIGFLYVFGADDADDADGSEKVVDGIASTAIGHVGKK